MTTAKLCRKCERVLPAASFRKNDKARDGLRSWCVECCNNDNREWNRRNSAYKTAENEVKRQGQHANALIYSKAVCDHVAKLVQTRIERFEKTTGMEAPPHLDALLSLARSLSEQHPEDLPSGEAVYSKAWRDANPEKVALWSERRRRKICPISIVCPVCGGVFSISPTNRKTKYCSSKCRDRASYLRLTPEQRREKNRRYRAGLRERSIHARALP